MPDQEITRLRTYLATKREVRLAIVFGSVANGTARAASDLDIAVDLGRAMTVDERIDTITSLATLTGRPIDLIDLHTAGEPLLGQILKHGTRLVGSNTHFGQLIARHMTDTADFMPLKRRILAERRQAWIGK